MLLVRMDKNSEPQPFTLAEWQQFCDAGGVVPAGGAHSGDKRTEREGDGGTEAKADEAEGSRKKQRKT